MNPNESRREPTAGLKGLNSMPLLLPTGGNQLLQRQVMSPIETGDGQRQQDQEVRLQQHFRIDEGDEESEEEWFEAEDLTRNDTFDEPLDVYVDLVPQLQILDAVENGEYAQGDTNGGEAPTTPNGARRNLYIEEGSGRSIDTD